VGGERAAARLVNDWNVRADGISVREPAVKGGKDSGGDRDGKSALR
jgi:hypothetical protein